MRSHLLLALAVLPAWAGEFSTFIGDTRDYHVARIQADAAGNTYIAGNRTSDGAGSAFVMKLNPEGQITVFNTFSGKGTDTVNDLAIDSAGNFYIAGSTTSLYLPVRNAFQAAPGPGFVVKLTPDATQIVFSTYFPAAIRALAVDAAGSVYVTGLTNLPTFPVTPGMPAGRVSSFTSIGSASGAFISKLSAAGDRLVYSGLVSGHNKDCGCCSSCFLSARTTMGVSIAVDPAGNAYMAGYTDTSDLPTTTGALLTQGTGAFVMKVSAAGTGLDYLTYVGATHYPLSPGTNPANIANSIAVDATGNVYLAGATSDPQFPASKGAYQSVYAAPATQELFLPPADAFVLKLNSSGTAVVWASYLGGRSADAANAVAVDAAGSVWIAGTTSSSDFPNSQGWSQGGDFVAQFNAAGTALPYAARFPNAAASQSAAVDGAGLVHVAGPAGLVSALPANGTPLMRIVGIANAAYGGVGGQIAPGELISIYGPHIGPPEPVTAVPDSTGALPNALAGMQVLAVGSGPLSLFVGVPLTLLYVSDSQINAVVPYNVYGAYALKIARSGVASPNFPVTISGAEPEIFRNTGGNAVAVNQDGTFNSADHPAAAGSMVSVWATGAGGSAPADWGRIAPVARNTNCCTITVSGVPAYVAYAGDAPGAVGGVVQINFEVPPIPLYGAFNGVADLVLMVGGASSQSAGIHVVTNSNP